MTQRGHSRRPLASRRQTLPVARVTCPSHVRGSDIYGHGNLISRVYSCPGPANFISNECCEREHDPGGYLNLLRREEARGRNLFRLNAEVAGPASVSASPCCHCVDPAPVMGAEHWSLVARLDIWLGTQIVRARTSVSELLVNTVKHLFCQY